MSLTKVLEQQSPSSDDAASLPPGMHAQTPPSQRLERQSLFLVQIDP
jgi:hypothetical protein